MRADLEKFDLPGSGDPASGQEEIVNAQDLYYNIRRK